MDAHASPHPTDQTLSSYGLGKLADGPAELVNEHLERCPECRERVAEMSADSFLGRVRDAHAGKLASAKSQTGGTWNEKKPGAMPASTTMPPGLAEHPDYEIKRELGRGGMGVVYLAHNTLMGRDEVLKVMGRQIMERPGVLERFVREIRAVARLRHPNIVTAYHASRLGENTVFAMEYVEGYDLAQLVKGQGPLPVSLACNFIYQAALGLQHAHEEGLVHRDIKPGNLMLSRKGKKATVKVLDFGLAKATREENVDGGLTSEGQALGTPDFIAPEQILDAPSADIRADIYSLGGTLYYLLSGRPPFQANSLYDMYQAHISRDADPLNFVRPAVPAELASLVSKMMAKEPARRFQTPAEVALALTPFFKSGAVRAQMETSRAGQSEVGGLMHAGQPVPNQPETSAAGSSAAPRSAAVPSQPEPRWESLIELTETERSSDAVQPKRVPAAGKWRRLPWMTWPAIAASSLIGFIALGIIIYVVTDKGRIKIVVDGLYEPKPTQDEPPVPSVANSKVVDPRSDAFQPGAFAGTEWTGDTKGYLNGKEHAAGQVRMVIDRADENGFLAQYWVNDEARLRLHGRGSLEFRGTIDNRWRVKVDKVAIGHGSWSNDFVDNMTLEGEIKNDMLTLRFSNRVTGHTGTISVKPTGWVSLFNGKDLTGWVVDSGAENAWQAKNGELVVHAAAEAWSGRTEGYLLTERNFADFDLRFQFQRSSDSAASGIALRAVPRETTRNSNPDHDGDYPFHLTVWIGKTAARDYDKTGTLWWSPNGAASPPLTPDRLAELKPGGEWNDMEVEMRGQSLRIAVNGRDVLNVMLNKTRPDKFPAPGLNRYSGTIGFLKGAGEVRFRQIEIKEPLLSNVKDAPPTSHERKLLETVTNTLGMKLKLIPPGEFLMGSPDDDTDADEDQKPRHRVRITRPFYLGATEVTRGQFQRFVDEAGYRTESEKDGKGGWGWNDELKKVDRNARFTWRNPGFEQSDEHPVVNVSSIDAVSLTARLSQKEKKGYRLPTEAEWEYACRAKTTTNYCTGDDPESLAAVGNILDGTAKARYAKLNFTTIAAQDGYVCTAPVGQFAPNGFGLFDMHGNVWEWCSDGYDSDYYKRSTTADPPGAVQTAHAVCRGGSWLDFPRESRSASRYEFAPEYVTSTLGYRSSNLGFRLVLVPSDR